MNNKPTDSLIELKPCPFCGESVDYVYRGDYDKKSRPAEYDIQCKTTGCYLEFGAGWYGLQEDIANKWNARLSTPVIERKLCCPGCGKDAGHDREYPPNPYYCDECASKEQP